LVALHIYGDEPVEPALSATRRRRPTFAQRRPDRPGPDFFRFSREEEFAGVLRGTGLEDVEVETLEFTHPVASVDELWDGLLGGTVRTSALIVGQPDETRERIRVEFDRVVSQYRSRDRLELPVSVKLAAGRKPLGSRHEP
jgi:hypothetical protein